MGNELYEINKLRSRLFDVFISSNITSAKLARDIGISYRTLKKLFDGYDTFELRTIGSIIAFLRKYDKENV